jgi:hypothetical protein
LRGMKMATWWTPKNLSVNSKGNAMINSIDVLRRITEINSSDTLAVIPVGDHENKNRGILQVDAEKWPKLSRAVLQSFGAAILALSMAVPQQAHAEGVGYNADVYGAGNGQVMQQGVGERMVMSRRSRKA